VTRDGQRLIGLAFAGLSVSQGGTRMKRIGLWGSLVLAPALSGVPGCRTTPVESMGTLSAKGHRPEFHITRKKDDSAKRAELAARSRPSAAPAVARAKQQALETAQRPEAAPALIASASATNSAPDAAPANGLVDAGFNLPPQDGAPVQQIATGDPFAQDTDPAMVASAADSTSALSEASPPEDAELFATERAPRPIPADDVAAPDVETASSQISADSTADSVDNQPQVDITPTQPVIDGPFAAALSQLASGLPMQQKSALRQLEKLGREAQPTAAACRELLNSRDADVRAAAALAIWRIEPDAAACLAGLRDGLTSSDASLRELCVWSLGDMGSAASDALPALTQACSHTDAHTAILAAEAIARIQPENIDAVNTLIRALHHDDRQVRQLAAYAVAGIAPRDRASVFNLGRCLRDEDARVRAAAAFALGQIGPAAASAAPALETCLRDANEQVRANAELALTRIRGGESAGESN
jgi:HEAT repeat protein